MEQEMKDKMADLPKVKEEIVKAKDSVTQPWLDSRPVIDELEKMKVLLENSRNRAQETDNIFQQLKGELDSVHGRIRDRNEGGRKANTIISEANQALEQTREDMKQLKEVTDEYKRMRAKLKQTLRVKRQVLRKVQLTLRAVRMETEAYSGSKAEAVQHLNRLETENSTVEDYVALTKRAKEETSLGDWRISISVEQRLLAEASSEAAVKKLKEYYSEERLKNLQFEKEEKGKVIQKVLLHEHVNVTTEMGNAGVISRSRSALGSSMGSTPSRRNESILGQDEKSKRSTRRRANGQQKRRSWLFYRIRRFFVQKIVRLFK